MELERTPNCAVTDLRTFHEIMPGVNDADMLFDSIHMTKQGATVYTNWLTEQMLKDPKIVAAMRTLHKPEEFFAKKFAQKAWRKVAGSLKKKPDVKPIQVAAPLNTIPMR